MNITDHPVVASLAPVFILIGLGFIAGKRQWIRESAVKDLTNLVFFLLIPALLFRTMSTVHLETLELKPMLAYFFAALVLLCGSIVWRGFDRKSVVMALGGVFSNMVMIGIPLVQMAYGKEGLVTLLTLVSVHAIVVLTTATCALEFAVAREQRGQGTGLPSTLSVVWTAFKNALIHPVPLPIVAGLLFAQTGWSVPPVVDLPMRLLGSAFGPVSLVLLGTSISASPIRGQLKPALEMVCAKNVVLPLMVFLSAWALGVQGLALTILVVVAALPMGSNVYLFAQRYGVATDLCATGMGLSTFLALFTLSSIMLLMAFLNAAG